MADTDYKYKETAVVYLDVWGFRDKVERGIRQDPSQLMEVAKSLERMHKGMMRSKVLNAHIFSDTIVLTFRYSCDVPSYGMTMLSVFQAFHAMRGFFLRGGIALGDHYERDQVMFGPAYTNAYELEKLAMWPRVLVHPSVLTGAARWINSTLRDEYGLTYVDYLYNAFLASTCTEWESEYMGDSERLPLISHDLLERHRLAVLNAIAKTEDVGLLAMYHALASYHNGVVERLARNLQVWHDAPDLAGAVAGNSPLTVLVDMFLAGESKKSDSSAFLATKIAELIEDRGTLRGSIIDLPAAFPELSGTARKAL